MQIISKATLNNGIEMPYFGLGVWKMKDGDETINAVKKALDTGYRLIDTAQYYRNEASVGEAIRRSGVPREEVFVTSKVEISKFGYEKTIKSVEESIERFGYDYFDLFLLHFPIRKLWKESWRALEELYKDGKVRAIGVSNFAIFQLEELLNEFEVVPAVNQVEFSPYLYRKELHKFCRKSKIQLNGYSPLVQASRLDDPKLVEIAKRYDKTSAQILIKWALQHEVVTIPKSSNPKRIETNANVFDFEISKEDMERLNAFDENYMTSWFGDKKITTFLVSTWVVRWLSGVLRM